MILPPSCFSRSAESIHIHTFPKMPLGDVDLWVNQVQGHGLTSIGHFAYNLMRLDNNSINRLFYVSISFQTKVIESFDLRWPSKCLLTQNYTRDVILGVTSWEQNWLSRNLRVIKTLRSHVCFCFQMSSPVPAEGRTVTGSSPHDSDRPHQPSWTLGASPTDLARDSRVFLPRRWFTKTCLEVSTQPNQGISAIIANILETLNSNTNTIQTLNVKLDAIIAQLMEGEVSHELSQVNCWRSALLISWMESVDPKSAWIMVQVNFRRVGLESFKQNLSRSQVWSENY